MSNEDYMQWVAFTLRGLEKVFHQAKDKLTDKDIQRILTVALNLDLELRELSEK